MAEELQRARDEGETVFLTGASGFVGSHVLRALLDARYRVRVLVRPGSRPPVAREGCTTVEGDILRAGELVRSMAGCRYLVHVASLYSFSPRLRAAMRATNVDGCAGVLEAAYLAGIERAVVTSSSSTVGPCEDGHPATEENWDKEESGSAYHCSKLQQARVALAARVPTVLVLPTAPVGPGDWKPTPTGKMILDFMRGRIFATLGGGLNIVSVEDVASAHVLALRHGRPRERYLIGGENVSLAQLWDRLAQVCGRSAPNRRVPFHLALALGQADELRCRLVQRVMGRTIEPVIPVEGVRMGVHQMYASSAKAQAEFGYTATAVDGALEQAVRWYRDHGYVR
jgi:dihydroflavonol-4-reductase